MEKGKRSDYLLKDFGKQLKNNHLAMRRHFTPRETDCYRVYDRNIGELPVTVDIYGSFVHLVDYRENPGDMEASGAGIVNGEKIAETAARMLYVKREQIVYKQRRARREGEQHGKLSQSGEFLEVKENGLGFLVNLVDYTDTGLFLDHRRTREMVFESAAGKRVLNLFAYTGSFSVYAAAGGAAEVDTVDLSGNYLKWTQKNMEVNGIAGSQFRFIRSDAAAFLKEAGERKKRYDLIILDPPTFSNSRNMEGTFDIQRDYVSMINACASILSGDGAVFFSTNYKKFHFDPGRLRKLQAHDITNLTIDVDFSKKRKPHRCWVLERRRQK